MRRDSLTAFESSTSRCGAALTVDPYGRDEGVKGARGRGSALCTRSEGLRHVRGPRSGQAERVHADSGGSGGPL
jgi:hypothetical protein